MEGITILQHNVLQWSFRRRLELSNIYLSLSPDVVLLNSTGIPDTERIRLFNYNVYQRNRSGEANSGSAIAVRKSIPHKIIDHLDNDLLAIELQTTRGPIIISTVYLPPRRYEFPVQDILSLMRKPLPVYLFGDLNARHVALGHPSNNAFGRYIFDLIRRNLLTFLGPDFHTFIGQARPGKPDILLSNRFHSYNYSLTQGPLTTSDHLPVILKLSTKAILVPTPPRHNLKQANWDLFQESLIDMMAAHQEPDGIIKNREYIDSKIETWYQFIRTARDRHIPIAHFTPLPHAKSSDLLKLLQWRFQRWQQYVQRHGLSPDAVRALHILQNQIQEESLRLHTEHWSTLLGKIDIAKSNPNIFWSRIKRLLGFNKESAPYIMDNGTKLFTPEEQEPVFRAFWSNTFRITPEENQHFDQNHEALVNQAIEDRIQDLLPYDTVDLDRLDPADPLLAPIELDDIKRIVRGFKNKAPGQSQVNRVIFKNLPLCMAEFYLITLNETLSMGYFPIYYKQALLCFVGKPNKDITSVENYRPISLLEVPGKIFEKILTERLNQFLEDNNLLNNNQFGFARGRGTQAAIAKLYEFIAISQREGRGCNVVSRDVQKAFDKVWHNGLKFKFLEVNLPDILLRTHCNFLDDRVASIKIGQHIGPAIQLQSGVPQGSVLSPTLYCFYIRDVPPPSPGCLQILFADDQTQVITHLTKNKRYLQRKTCREIEAVNAYEKLWKIKTNVNKFQLLSVSTLRPMEIIVNNILIPFNRQLTVLGYTINTRGLKPHVTSRLNKARGTVAKLHRFRGVSTSTSLRLYKALVRSRLEYPAVGLCGVRKTNMKNMQAIQNKMLRRSYREAPPYFNTIKDLHLRSKLEPLNVRLHRLANKTWEKLRLLDPELVNYSQELDTREGRDHNWWPRLSSIITQNQPRPVYRSGIPD